jgi:1,2-diacylglycerol 3-beta-galactosyltransferase
MPRLDFVFFDAGGGHRSAATALKAVAEARHPKWSIRLVNLQETLDSLDVFRKLTGFRLQELYNTMLEKGWTLGSQYLIPFMQSVIRKHHNRSVRMLCDLWSQDKPDLVVSVVPNFNRALREAFDLVNPGAPFITILTDLADYPPHFWIERQEQYWICGTRLAVEQAKAIGGHPGKVFGVSGMILRPDFYKAEHSDRRTERVRLGLHPDRPTGIVMFGGFGSPLMTQITRLLADARLDLQLILICGRNEKLAEQLRRRETPFPKHVVGFTHDVPHFMNLADFFIGKPGPGSISEAIAMRLPVVIQRNAWTLPQERYNADWVLENQVGIVLPAFTHLVPALQTALARGDLVRFRANAAGIQNRAVFEIVDILQRLLSRSS